MDFEKLEELQTKNRSYRSFDESKPIPRDVMEKLIDLARKTASGCNFQPLRYKILSKEEDLVKMMANSRFAKSLAADLPPKRHCPTGFILMFTDNDVQSPETLALKDVGIAAETIMLGATALGFGGCMLGSFNAERLMADFAVPARYTPRLVLALGTPDETCVLTEAVDGNVTYYRADGVHYVPKRPLKDILL